MDWLLLMNTAFVTEPTFASEQILISPKLELNCSDHSRAQAYLKYKSSIKPGSAQIEHV